MKPAIAALATILSIGMLVAGLLSLFLFFLCSGLPPCAPESGFYLLSQLAIPVALLIGAAWMGRLKWQPSGRGFLIALALPAVALLSFREMHTRDAQAQLQCRSAPTTPPLRR